MTAPSSSDTAPLTVMQLGQLLSALVANPSVQNVWVQAELSDVRVSRGHCYMELLQKDPGTGVPVARMRAACWASVFSRLAPEFRRFTGQEFKSGLNVKLRGSATYHPLYGMAFNVVAADPSFTLGEVERRRAMILQQLMTAGILNSNKQLQWPLTPQRVAVISGEGAAGYGDFRKQLLLNPYRLRFDMSLFPALVQGAEAPRSILASLRQIAAVADRWDCVVIIRGGGATGDLVAFEDFELARSVASFPLPVIVGVGHDRDVTVLDFVANTVVKTPTAAADVLIGRVADALTGVEQTVAAIHRAVADRIVAEKQHLSFAGSLLTVAPRARLERAVAHQRQLHLQFGSLGSSLLAPRKAKLQTAAELLSTLSRAVLTSRRQTLESREKLLEVLSPQATLARGYSISRVRGKAITGPGQISQGDVLETTLAFGTITTVKK